MSSFLPHRARGPDPASEATPLHDPRQERVQAEQRWELRAAMWQAAFLARSVFGRDVAVRLSECILEGPFRALLHVEVPFEGLSGHREREARFTAAAGHDPILARVPFVYVFSPLTSR